MPWWKFWEKDEPERGVQALRRHTSSNPVMTERIGDDGVARFYSAAPETLDYFDLFAEIEGHRSNSDYDAAFASAKKGMNLLPDFVADQVQRFGSFEISSIPPLAFSLLYLSLHDQPEELDRIEGIIESTPALHGWRDAVARSRNDRGVVQRCIDLIRAEPGFVQRDLGKTLGVDGRNAATLMAHAKKAGLVRRERHKKTYRLFVG